MLKTATKLALGCGSTRSYGQNGEDAVARALLREAGRGVYVDVGAYHPVLYSNTYAFYRRGWKGLVIDPNKTMRPLFRLFRPRDAFVCAGVGASSGSATYYAFSDGAYNTFDPAEAALRKQNKNLHFLGERNVDIKPLADIVHEQQISHIDFLTVDVEGMDLTVLRSHDWAVPPRVIAVESTHFDPDHPEADPVYRFLRDKGYVLRGLTLFTLLFVRYQEMA